MTGSFSVRVKNNQYYEKIMNNKIKLKHYGGINMTENNNDMVLTKDGIWMTHKEYIEMIKAERD